MTPRSSTSSCGALALLLAAFAPAQQPITLAEPDAGFVAIDQAMRDVQQDLVVLNVAAHPDDESSRTNTMLRRKYGARVVTVYSTYGDGGQNAIGREIGPELAHLRVRETLRASAMMDVEVRWLGMEDFGFSKTLDEALAKWGADRLKTAMRKVIDSVDPDVILTNHSLTRGHGHHRASIWAAIEVLKERQAAGRFAPLLYARCAVDKAQRVFDPAQLDLVRGETYARLAHDAWTRHVTQGPWRDHDPLRVGKDYWQVVFPENASLPEPGSEALYLQRDGVGGTRLPVDLMAQPDDQRKRTVLGVLAETRKALREAVAALQAGGDLRRVNVLRRRVDALQRLYLALIGVRVEIWLEDEDVPIGGRGKGYVVVHGHERVQALVVRCDDAEAEPVRLPPQQTPFDDAAPAPPRPRIPTPPVPGNGAAVQPGELPEDDTKDTQDVASDPPLPGRFEYGFECDFTREDGVPEGPEPSFVLVEVAFEADGAQFLVLKSLAYTPVAPVEIAWDREVVLVPRGQRSTRMLSVSVRNHEGYKINAGVRLQMGPGIEAEAIPGRIAFGDEQDEARVLVRTVVDAEQMTADAGLAVGFRDDTVRLPLRIVDVTVPEGMRIALVRGPEDSTERTLEDLGIPYESLDRDGLLAAELERFGCVLLDIRAYHHRPELAELRERLQQYVRGGGRVVAMYHKPREWNEREGHPQLAPFSLVVGNDRVTEEDSPVTLLQADHRLMTWPHRIGEADFAGWVQERGLNFPSKWDPAWTPLLSMKDSGDEKPHEGALLYTQYGKGDFVYCSLGLYRQLRIGNPGAVRLLVNLLAR